MIHSVIISKKIRNKKNRLTYDLDERYSQRSAVVNFRRWSNPVTL